MRLQKRMEGKAKTSLSGFLFSVKWWKWSIGVAAIAIIASLLIFRVSRDEDAEILVFTEEETEWVLNNQLLYTLDDAELIAFIEQEGLWDEETTGSGGMEYFTEEELDSTVIDQF